MAGASLPALGPMEPSAQRLVQRARSLARSGQPLDVLHVMLAAIPDDLERPSSAASAALLSSTGEPQVLRRLLSVELRLNVPAGRTGEISEALVRCAGAWRRVASERGIGVNDALVLWAVIADTNAASQTLDELAVDRAALLGQLELLTNREETELPPDTTRLGVRVPPSSLPADQAAAYQRAGELTLVIRPTNRQRMRDRHAVLMSTVLDTLGTCEPTELPIVVGHNGSPIDAIPRVLADRLVGGEAFIDQRARLSRYHAVHLLDIQSVVQLARMDDEPDPQDVLEMAMLQSIEDQAILVLDRLEDLKEEHATELSVVAQLTDRGDALVLGLYELPDGGEENVEEELGLNSLVLVASHEYSPSESKVLLFEHYIPEWEPRGFSFEPDAFDTVIALADGSWIELRRKRLPYLAVELGQSTMGMLRDGRALISQSARMAREALEALKQEAATTEERTRDRFARALEEARRDIEWLIQNPDPIKENGIFVVKRAHVTSQLICPNASEFHYPGHAPRERIRRRMEDLPAEE